MNVYLQDPATKFHEAVITHYIKIGYEAHDFFAADIYYHNSCQIKFTLKKIKQAVDQTFELLENNILEKFFLALKKIIVHEKEAFFLSDQLQDIKGLSKLNGLTEPIIDKFSDDISFYPKGKYLIVHSSDINPCEYVVAILKGKR